MIEAQLSLIFSGIVSGSLYGLLGFGIVLIFRSTDVVNFSQGELGLLSTYFTWMLAKHLPIWTAIAVSSALAFFIGVLVELLLLRKLEVWQSLNAVVLTIGLSAVINSTVLWYFSAVPQTLPTVFGDGTFSNGALTISYQGLGTVCLAAALSILLFLFFRFTRIGLALRATAQNRTAAKLVGVNTGTMSRIAWGLSGVFGAVAGAFIAPTLFLTPAMMQSILAYAVIGVTIGGLESPLGALVGGIIVGVLEALAGQWAPIGSDLKLVAVLICMVLTLIIRPQGIFGQRKVRKV